MKIGLSLISLLLIVACAFGGTYDGYKVYSVSPKSLEQLDALKGLEDELQLDFWEELKRVHFDRTYRVMVGQNYQSQFESEMIENQITYSIEISDVNQMVSDELQRNEHARQRGRNVPGVDFSHFWQFDEIREYLERIETEYPDLVELEILGQTYEGQDIIAVKISKSGPVDNSRPLILLEGTIHAREWISPMVCMHLISELVENSAAHDDFLDGLDWIIVPVLNVDGYSYTYAPGGNRFWRKNRSPIPEFIANPNACPGTDLNRNFRFRWEVQASTSTNPCGETWPGHEAESENETKIISDLMLKYSNAKLWLDVHSYGNYLLYPWSYDYISVENYLDHQELGVRARDAIYNVNQTQYSMGNSALTLYRCSGVTTDFAIGVANIPLSWTIELPGGGTRGFDIEPHRIQSVIDETFPSIREMALFVRERYVTK